MGELLRVVAIGGEGGTFENELFGSLLLESLIGQLRAQSRAREDVGNLVIVGADWLTPNQFRLLDRLAERAHFHALYLFARLSEDSAQVIGGNGAMVGIMRLGNHQEAERAAQFIGQTHRFVLSQISETTGTSNTNTTGSTTSVSDSLSDTETFGQNWGQDGNGDSSSKSRSHGFTATTGTTQSYGDSVGTNESRSETRQRIREFEVEPTVLQNLPPTALRFARPGEQPIAIDVHPGCSVYVPGEPYTATANAVRDRTRAHGRALVKLLGASLSDEEARSTASRLVDQAIDRTILPTDRRDAVVWMTATMLATMHRPASEWNGHVANYIGWEIGSWFRTAWIAEPVFATLLTDLSKIQEEHLGLEDAANASQFAAFQRLPVDGQREVVATAGWAIAHQGEAA